ncbi:GNAT family N-acetyltransferase [Ruminococcaceae bacterium OttesenSCG-928-L11]|nr:GNAT family N-acetyltransferase [Ruminococcaceae bacterium OttesenSCG-928-L11]
MSFNEFFQSIPSLETERLTLRAFRRDDIPRYLPMIRDPDVRQFLGGGVNDLTNDRHVENWLRNINGRLLQSKTVFTWCVEYKPEQQNIGRIDLGGFVRKSMADLAYYIAKDYWNRGIATEAVNRVVEFGFSQLKLHRIQAIVQTENIASLKVLQKAGFEAEGILRKYAFGKEFHDVVMLSVLNEQSATVD